MAEIRKAEFRRDLIDLSFADGLKAQMSLHFGHNTPVTCLSCKNCSPMADSCTKNLDLAKVRNDEMFIVTLDTPLTDICTGFESNEIPLT